LKVLNILGDVVEPAKQIPWIDQRCHRRLAKRSSSAKPFLTADMDKNAIRGFPDRDGQGGATAGGGPHAGANLHGKIIFRPNELSPQISPVKLGHECPCNIRGVDFAVQKLLLHESDYNREPASNSISIKHMKAYAPFARLSLLFFALFAGSLPGLLPGGVASAQAIATDTPGSASAQPFITNTFEGEPAINVRTGPSTIAYPVPCGTLVFGASSPALGVSPGHEWIEIPYPSCPGGVGWIYAANVVLTGGPLRIVEPPSTPTPLATSTIDPTLEAAFHQVPTETRLPTFTPAPPVTVPTFSTVKTAEGAVPAGMPIIAIGLIGGAVLAASFIAKR
jgi:hypothetical protein